jgi:glycosyltransferase involved in cell wall biosynthesis
MNILIAVPWDQESGGVALVVGHLATNLRRAGHGVWFLHPGDTRRLRRRTTKWGFPGYVANLRSPTDAPTLWSRAVWLVTLPFTLLSLLWVMRRHRISVVNVHFPSAMFGYFALCRRLVPGSRLVVSIHGTDLLNPQGQPRAVDRVFRWLLRAADKVVAPSTGFAAQCAPVLPNAGEGTEVILNGTDLGALVEQGVEREEASLLAVASLDHWKGLDVLLRAMALLHDEFPSLRLECAGEGPERRRLEALALSLGLGASVTFVGFLDRAALAGRLARCTVFVLPSRSEPFGIAVVEALAAGAPVVASDVGGIPEILQDGREGLLVPPGDPTALAAALRRLLNDARLRGQFSYRGPTRAADFPWSATAERYMEVFEQLQPPAS